MELIAKQAYSLLLSITALIKVANNWYKLYCVSYDKIKSYKLAYSGHRDTTNENNTIMLESAHLKYYTVEISYKEVINLKSDK